MQKVTLFYFCLKPIGFGNHGSILKPWHHLNFLILCLLKNSWNNSFQTPNIINSVVEMAADLMINGSLKGF